MRESQPNTAQQHHGKPNPPRKPPLPLTSNTTTPTHHSHRSFLNPLKSITMQFTQPYQQEIHIKDYWKELSKREEGKGRERNPISCLI